jgi:hypothetical protein
MSKQWYYEVMGSPVGPITSTELKTCVLTRRILPETRIRLGDDGKWQTADRVKGLFDGAPPAPKPQADAKPVAQAAARPATPAKPASAAETGTTEIATMQTAEIKISVASVTPALAAADAPPATEDDGDTEYDFFKFVGFEIAIGHALNDVLKEYCRVHHVTMTQTTRRALAEFLGRKDLSGGPVAATATPPAEVFGIG